MIDLNFSGTKKLEDVKFKPLEDGQYTFTVSGAEIKDSKDPTKKASMKVVLSLTDDPTKTIWQWLYLDPESEYGMAVLKDFLEKLYHTEIDGNITLDTEDLVGREIQAIVTQEPRQDKPKLMQNVVVEFIAVPF